MKLIQILLVSILCIYSSSLINAQNDNYCELLKYSLLFYKAQRAGRLPDSDIPWRGNSVLTDTYDGKLDSNGDGILSKGYFDAGDGVKFGFPMAYSMTMLGWIYVTYKDNIVNCGVDSLYKEVLRWGSDYNIAAHVSDNVFVGQVGEGDLDHSFWKSPENLTYTRKVFAVDSSKPGTDLVLEAAASLAVTSMVFASNDSDYSNKCLTHAKSLYSFAMNSENIKYSDSITDAAKFYPSYGYSDEIAWGSVWLYKATNEQSYLDKAVQYADYVKGSNELSWDDKGVPVQLILYQIKKETVYKTSLETALNHWLKGTGGGVQYTNGGLAYLRDWGVCRYSLNMALVAAMYAQSGDSYETFAKGQLSYILGNNPSGYSFVVGWGNKYPKNPHHRAAHHPSNTDTSNIDSPAQNTFILYGALVGGPDFNDNYADQRNNYVQSEVALDYNVGLVGTVAAFSKGSKAANKTNPYTGKDLDSNMGQSSDDSNLGSEDSDISDSISIHKFSSFILLISYLFFNVLLY